MLFLSGGICNQRFGLEVELLLLWVLLLMLAMALDDCVEGRFDADGGADIAALVGKAMVIGCIEDVI